MTPAHLLAPQAAAVRQAHPAAAGHHLCRAFCSAWTRPGPRPAADPLIPLAFALGRPLLAARRPAPAPSTTPTEVPS